MDQEEYEGQAIVSFILPNNKVTVISTNTIIVYDINLTKIYNLVKFQDIIEGEGLISGTSAPTIDILKVKKPEKLTFWIGLVHDLELLKE